MLYICATPIGNLKDITLRALEILQSVDEIACEDTRVSAKLLSHYGIKKPLFSYHEHNEQSKTAIIVEKLKSGSDIALVSDAGLPGISDPGKVLIKACIANDLPYTVLPGASAAVTALVAAALPAQPFYFHGFLERKQVAKQLAALRDLSVSLVFYESPHRLLKTLQQMLTVFGNRQLTVARELTKLHEEYRHFELMEAIAYYSENPVRGECVIVVAGRTASADQLPFDEVVALVERHLAEGARHKDVVKQMAKVHGVDRQALYRATLKA